MRKLHHRIRDDFYVMEREKWLNLYGRDIISSAQTISTNMLFVETRTGKILGLRLEDAPPVEPPFIQNDVSAVRFLRGDIQAGTPICKMGDPHPVTW